MREELEEAYLEANVPNKLVSPASNTVLKHTLGLEEFQLDEQTGKQVNVTNIWDPKQGEDRFSNSEARHVYFKLIKRGINFGMLGAQDL